MEKTSDACQGASKVAIEGSERDAAVKVAKTEASVDEKVATEVTKQEKVATEAAKAGVVIEASKQEMEKVGATEKDDVLSDGDSPFPSLGLPWKTGLNLFVLNLSCVFKLDKLGKEILNIAIPASLAMAADPLASLVDTAFMGQLGKSEVAAVGVSVAIFNQVSKVFIYPLVSVTTSFVAEEEAIISSDTEEQEVGDLETAKSTVHTASKQIPTPSADCANACKETESEKPQKSAKRKKFIPSVTSALIVGAILGIIQAILLIATAKFCILLMTGGKPSRLMRKLAVRYLTIRSLGAPAVLLSLAMIGVFRGFKDTKTPLYATVIGDIMNIVLEAIMVFGFRMGVTGAATAHVISQYLITLILFFKLIHRVNVIPPSIKSLKFGRFLGCGFMLLARVIAVTGCVTLATSLAARHGDTIMAAFQISNQVWISTSLLADGLAVAGQAIIATSFARSDYYKVAVSTARVLQFSIVLGLCLTALLGVFLRYGAGIFGKDSGVIAVVHQSIPFVAGLQTVNSVAFVFDGINFGASDYTFSAYSMVAVATVSVPCIIMLSGRNGFIGIWFALAIYMILRTLASTWRLGTATGPWAFLRKS
ncbi:Protein DETOXIFICATION [Rhynchospora pubera]|uniref:Protein DETOXIFICATION n=1 Tax=Rhynchospora pubera TaxID=906938 RepID=A0AAV8HVE9_9POAL|nr:Protein DETOXIFICATION [Rhynchospora pubera]